ncbi:TRADD-N-associated membrane domain-containing protein [Streptomyces virginiae]|uniref:TRADD-N-associated membrane domain-containing protein n=1 Tax=Streptomyces virginiae TaxID=1961 RepID=UPI002251FDFF|nr:hypothetical protein [Streptomyces virginiae]MCX5178368.1 hypothetical protein [Streptomyces virginiae]
MLNEENSEWRDKFISASSEGIEILDADSAQDIVSGWTPEDDTRSDHVHRYSSARNRERWMNTEDGKSAYKGYVKAMSVAAAAFIVCLCGAAAALIFKAGWPVGLLIFGAGLLICYACLMIGRYKYVHAREAARAASDLGHARGGEASSRWLRDLDLQNLIEINRAQMKVYQELTTRQAKIASHSCQAAMVFGFLMLVAGAVIALKIATDPAAQVVVGSLAVIGSGVSAYIGKTFFAAQRLAMDQLNLYYRQPLVTSYVLQAERLTNRLEEGSSKQHDMVEGVVKRVLAAARNAYEGGQVKRSDDEETSARE